MSDQVDIAIIGAGAAGIAAARRAQDYGLSFALLEARDRIGGRCHTDTTSLGLTWDRGAHWLHSAAVNPLTHMADALDQPYLKRESFIDRTLHLGSRLATEAEKADYQRAIDAGFEAVDVLGKQGLDVPVSDAHDREARWYRLIEHLHEAISAFPPERISALDLYRYYDSGENWPLIRGYGALVEALGAHLPVSLETPVTAVDWSGRGVALETPKGTVKAKAVIVTVSTNVLARGLIHFAPALPQGLQAALEGVPTGVANKVAIKFSRDVFGLPDTSYASFMDERDPARHAMSFQIRPFGQELAIAYLGGRFADEMEREGAASMIDMAQTALADMFGSSILGSVERAVATGWGADPYALGAYSSALPGHAEDRMTLAKPVGERIFLAGEAVHPSWFSTVQGAFLSGRDAAERACLAIGRRT